MHWVIEIKFGESESNYWEERMKFTKKQIASTWFSFLEVLMTNFVYQAHWCIAVNQCSCFFLNSYVLYHVPKYFGLLVIVGLLCESIVLVGQLAMILSLVDHDNGSYLMLNCKSFIWVSICI